jgi:hypothetical protein
VGGSYFWGEGSLEVVKMELSLWEFFVRDVMNEDTVRVCVCESSGLISCCVQ